MTTRTTSLLIILAVVLPAAVLPAAALRAQAPIWDNAWSIPRAGTENAIGIGTDAAGNIYVAGFALDYNAVDPLDAVTQFIQCASPGGTIRWTRTFLAGVRSARGAMDLDPAGNVYVTASFAGNTALVGNGAAFDTITAASGNNILVAKYDAAGRLLWHATASGSDSITAVAIAVTPGGIRIGGTFTGSVDLGATHLTSAGRSDVFLATIDTNGIFGTAVRGGGTSSDVCEGLAAAPNGEVVMLGTFRGTANFGDQSATAAGGANLFLTRYHADGSAAWARADGGSSFTPAFDFTRQPMLVRVDGEGTIYLGISYLQRISIAGTTLQAADEADALVVKYRPDGSAAWTAEFGGDVLQLVQGLAIDADGSVYVAGFAQDLPAGQVFLAKLTPAGAQAWEVINGLGDSFGNAEAGPVCIDAHHNLSMAGHFGGQTRFGDRLLTSVGSSPTTVQGDDIYLARLGLTSGVRPRAERFAGSPLFTVAQRDRQLLLLPAAGSPAVDAPAVLDAALYSLIGERIAVPVKAPVSANVPAPVKASGLGDAIRFDVGGLACGAYLLVVRTERGTMGWNVVIGR